MSYQVLARKWRPQGFDEVTGQNHVTTPLRNAIRSDRVPHAILLCGPRGVGKTTLARILARCLNCEKGPTETPCGVCAACVEISAGTSTDVQEIDAASRTSVDDVRELIESIRYAPTPGKHRIFVVDEVHMLSTAAFNALLKTLEEPPPHSLFVFATTNPEKVPYTVVSRCQRYDLRRIGAADLVARLAEVAKSEGLSLSDASLRAIARESEGSLRDALTLLDQVIASGGTEVDDERVGEILDLIDRRILLAIVAACVDGDAPAALEAAGRAAHAGVEPKRLGAELLGALRDLVVLRVAPDADLVEGSDAEVSELRELAERSDEARLRRMFRALLREQEDLAWAPQPQAVLEMALVRMATLASGDDVATLLARLDALERQLSGSPPPASGGGGGGGGGGARGRRAPRAAARAEEPPAPLAARSDEPPAAPAAPELGASPEQVFDQLKRFAQEQNRGLFSALEGGRIVERSNGHLRLALAEGFAARRLEGKKPELEDICGRFFGQPVKVTLEGAETPVETPDRKAESDLARKVRQEALRHPSVNATVDILGAEIVDIKPLGSGPGQGR